MFRRISTTMLTDGLVLASAIHDDQQRLLLGAGLRVTRELIAGLLVRNVQEVFVSEKDWRRITAFSSAGKSAKSLPQRQVERGRFSNSALDAAADRFSSTAILPSDDPFQATFQTKGVESYDRRRMDQIVDQHAAAVDQVCELLETLGGDGAIAVDDVQDVVTQSLAQAVEDIDLFVSMGINPGLNTSIYAHSQNVATLAVAIGARMGLNANTLRDLGIGCLVQNAGMLKLDSVLLDSTEILNDDDFVEIAKHPLISTDMLYQNMKGVPLAVRMIVYQIHERCDGSGYPRGCTADKIHPLAKIAAVADAYIALVSPRPYRHAMMPYHAMTKMLTDVKNGLFDSAVVRALLNTVSLFPIGSYVELNSAQVGKTIRSNGASYDRPILEVWERRNLTAKPQVVDLAAEADLKVVRPLTFLH
jgi:HD-GYP domain-containing protein (c-di-GMP phosphodiesterase class II)